MKKVLPQPTSLRRVIPLIGAFTATVMGRIGKFGNNPPLNIKNDENVSYLGVNKTNFLLATKVTYWTDYADMRTPVFETNKWYCRPVDFVFNGKKIKNDIDYFGEDVVSEPEARNNGESE